VTPSLLSLFACSGPGAGDAIATNIRIGYVGAVFSGLLLIPVFHAYNYGHGRRWPFLWSFILLIIHPAWTVSAIGGDCGGMKFVSTCFFTILATVFFVLQRRYSRPRP